MSRPSLHLQLRDISRKLVVGVEQALELKVLIASVRDMQACLKHRSAKDNIVHKLVFVWPVLRELIVAGHESHGHDSIFFGGGVFNNPLRNACKPVLNEFTFAKLREYKRDSATDRFAAVSVRLCRRKDTLLTVGNRGASELTLELPGLQRAAFAALKQNITLVNHLGVSFLDSSTSC
eukprot:CAMPEP_0171563590 /NCGR_PEP_ID=MMETSP0960-20121227/15792_1 /TAXON_ID=87120 /ORGANISM="Aurantiochytrium limacinum, Strain ATCCMYA-1381" /LENGTH=177 /DNA_ID=CAMNT_0012116829 /DNA_START=170 /DNA_END=703 /DNA_ORIENTATION=+